MASEMYHEEASAGYKKKPRTHDFLTLTEMPEVGSPCNMPGGSLCYALRQTGVFIWVVQERDTQNTICHSLVYIRASSKSRGCTNKNCGKLMDPSKPNTLKFKENECEKDKKHLHKEVDEWMGYSVKVKAVFRVKLAADARLLENRIVMRGRCWC
jgi:hypothetical protein